MIKEFFKNIFQYLYEQQYNVIQIWIFFKLSDMIQYIFE